MQLSRDELDDFLPSRLRQLRHRLEDSDLAPEELNPRYPGSCSITS